MSEEKYCACGHEQKDHFSLGCSRRNCDCAWFQDVDELPDGESGAFFRKLGEEASQWPKGEIPMCA